MKQRNTSTVYEPKHRQPTPLQQSKREAKDAREEAIGLRMEVEQLGEDVRDWEEQAKQLQLEKEALLRRIAELEATVATLSQPRSRPTPFESDLSKCKDEKKRREVCMSWLGVSNLDSLLASVTPYLSYYAKCRPAWDLKRFVTTYLTWIRQGFRAELMPALLNSDRSCTSMRRDLQAFLTELYPWAVSQIKLPTLNEWIATHAREVNSGKPFSRTLQDLFPLKLFFFVDGTVLEINRPADIARSRSNYNTKHACTAISFFIAVDPNGRIVYVSPLSNGNRHDATAWNRAPAFPPHVWNPDGSLPSRSDGVSFIQQLEEFYGEPGSASYVFYLIHSVLDLDFFLFCLEFIV
jgi:hypothetical protein